MAIGSSAMLSAFANGTMFGTRVGSGAPRILALHGWAGTNVQLSAVVEGLNAIVLDLPGHGASVEPDAVWGAEEYAKAIAPVLDEFPEPAVVLGYSFGGRIAVTLAAMYPEKVKALVLTGAPLLRRPTAATKTSKAYALAKWAHKRGLLSDERMEAERRKRGSADYRNARGIMRDVLVRSVNETYEAQLGQVRCPVSFVWGEADTAAPVWIIEEAKALLPATTITSVDITPGADHFLPIHTPAPLQRALREALS